MDNQFKPTHSGTPPEALVDVRVQLIKSIWGFATAMLGISIPLVGLTRSPWLPVCVLLAAAAGTAAVCLSKIGTSQTSNSLEATQEQLRQMEERLSHVETISRFERSLHERDTVSGQEETYSQSPEGTRSSPRPSTPISY
ncbi:hypothetical protein IAD21_02670 [Abditibacteriota bacterium]|nr:hypothetical protein IAD21_02670 [Abditibacteriota bacterium]